DALGELLFTYKYIREQLEGIPTSITNLSTEEKAHAKKYVNDFFKNSGFEFRVLQYAAGEFGYSELMAVIESYEVMGYEVHFCSLDYMGKMST
ncbi:DnaB family ATPase, partial [Klebsiella pneumoniae]